MYIWYHFAFSTLFNSMHAPSNTKTLWMLDIIGRLFKIFCRISHKSTWNGYRCQSVWSWWIWSHWLQGICTSTPTRYPQRGRCFFNVALISIISFVADYLKHLCICDNANISDTNIDFRYTFPHFGKTSMLTWTRYGTYV